MVASVSGAVFHIVLHRTTASSPATDVINACSKVLMALACLCCVTQAAQQITDVAEVECGIFLFVLFCFLFSKCKQLIAAPHTTALSASLD